MKKICVLLTFTCVCVFLHAQEKTSKFSLSFFAGPTLTNNILSPRNTWPGNVFDSLETPKLGYSFGGLAGYSFNKKFTLQVGLSFSNNGYQYKKHDDLRFEYQYDSSGVGFNPDTLKIAAKFIYQRWYVDVPVQLKYTFFQKKKVSLYAIAGLEANFNLTNRQTSIFWHDGEKERHISSDNLFRYEESRRFNCSAIVGLGIEYAVSQKVSLFAQVTYRQMLLPEADTPLKRRLYSFGVFAGVRIKL